MLGMNRFDRGREKGHKKYENLSIHPLMLINLHPLFFKDTLIFEGTR